MEFNTKVILMVGSSIPPPSMITNFDKLGFNPALNAGELGGRSSNNANVPNRIMTVFSDNIGGGDVENTPEKLSRFYNRHNNMWKDNDHNLRHVYPLRTHNPNADIILSWDSNTDQGTLERREYISCGRRCCWYEQ